MSETLVMSRPCAGTGLGVRTTSRHGSEGQLREFAPAPLLFCAGLYYRVRFGQRILQLCECVTCQPCRTRFCVYTVNVYSLTHAGGLLSWPTLPLRPNICLSATATSRTPPKWVNVELTTQSLSRELFYIENFGISAEAIRNNVYLYPLSDKETVAYLLAELAAYYYRTFSRYDDFMLKCAEKSLQYFSPNPMALHQKGNVLNMRLMDYLKKHDNRMDDYARSLDTLWLKNRAVIQKLGWADMPDSIYRGLLKGVESDMQSKGFDSQARQQAIDKLKKADKKQ